jgi:hypothetical protein
VRGIVEFDLEHGCTLQHRDPEHGRVVGQHRVVLVVGFVGFVVLTQVDGERQGDTLEFGTQADSRGSAQ